MIQSCKKRILYSTILHNSPCCPQNFAKTIVVKYFSEYADLPRAFHNNSLCKKQGGNLDRL